MTGGLAGWLRLRRDRGGADRDRGQVEPGDGERTWWGVEHAGEHGHEDLGQYPPDASGQAQCQHQPAGGGRQRLAVVCWPAYTELGDRRSHSR